MKASALGAFLICGTLLCVAQSNPEPHTFFKEAIGLNDSEIMDLQHGTAVAKVLSTATSAEIVIFGAIYIRAPLAGYLKVMQDLDSLRGLPRYLAIQRFSTPPALSDLKDFTLDADDIRDLKRCRLGKCELQLPAESMEAFRTSIDWSAPDVSAPVNRLAQEMALQELLKYQKDGDRALGTYYDKAEPLQVMEQFEFLLGEFAAVSHYLPDLARYLYGYPRARLPNVQNVFYWEKVRFGLKPILRINHMVIYRGQGISGPINSVAIKQLYASHYFQTALDLSVGVQDSRPHGENGFYLITLKGSRQAGLTGPKGSIIRSAVISRSRSSLEHLLLRIKTLLENGEEPATGQQ